MIASHPDGEDQDEVYMIDDFVIDLIAATPQKPNVNVVKKMSRLESQQNIAGKVYIYSKSI